MVEAIQTCLPWPSTTLLRSTTTSPQVFNSLFVFVLFIINIICISQRLMLVRLVRDSFQAVATHHLLMFFSLALLSIVSGTSASSPVLAGMVALVNAARINAGKSPLGMFLLLYFIFYKMLFVFVLCFRSWNGQQYHLPMCIDFCFVFVFVNTCFLRLDQPDAVSVVRRLCYRHHRRYVTYFIIFCSLITDAL